MTQPSLAVLFIGGWGLAERTKENLFRGEGGMFLEDFWSRYPALALERMKPNADLIETYKTIGHTDEEVSLMNILSQHERRQFLVADADRYGLLTQTLYSGISDAELKKDVYGANPPFTSMARMPAATTDRLQDVLTDEFTRRPTNTLFACGLSAIWAALPYKKISVIRQAIESTEKAAVKIVEKALEAQMRVLIVADSNGAEQLITAEGEFDETPRETMLPCILIDQNSEGLQAEMDIGQEASRLKPAGSLQDIAPTILALMGIPAPKQMPGNILFDRFIETP